MDSSAEDIKVGGCSNDFVFVYTCGLCKTICDKDEVIVHGCLRDYNDYHIDDGTHYFYPMLDDGKNCVQCSYINGTEQMTIVPIDKIGLIGNKTDVLQSQSAALSSGQNIISGLKRTVGAMRLSTFEEELLILAVRKRRPLWDSSLPTNQKSRALRRRLWNEVSHKLKGKLDAAGCQQKFRSLRDTYRKIIHSEHLPNGFARVEGSHKWKHYDVMEFIRDNMDLIKDTASNIPANIASTPHVISDSIKSGCDEQEECNSDEADGPAGENFTPNNQRSQRLMSSRSENSNLTVTTSSPLDQSVGTRREQMPNDVIVRQMPQPDEIDGFLQIINSDLRQMSLQVRRRTMQEIIMMTFSRLENDTQI